MILLPAGTHPALRRLAHAPRLPKVTSLVRRNDVQRRGKAESYAGDKGIPEAHSGKIHVSVLPQKRADLVLRCHELVHCVTECRRGTRPNATRRF
jgi:hypothetical protein